MRRPDVNGGELRRSLIHRGIIVPSPMLSGITRFHGDGLPVLALDDAGRREVVREIAVCLEQRGKRHEHYLERLAKDRGLDANHEA